MTPLDTGETACHTAHMHCFARRLALWLALLWLPTGLMAAPHKPPATPAKTRKKPKVIPHGPLIRIIPTRVTVFYSFKDKKTGRIYPKKTTSKPLKVKEFQRVKRK